MAEISNIPDIDVDSVCRIVLKARQFDVKEDVVEADPGSNQIDEGFREVLANYTDDPVYEELKTFIHDMDIDAQCELVALMWTGRGDFSGAEWAAALRLAHQEHSAHTPEYLLGTPLLADYLSEGLAQFDLSCEEMEKNRL